MIRRSLTTVFLVALAVSLALAQEKKSVPPPPKPADEGPSLEVTVKFIQDKLNEVGRVNFADYVHNNATNNDRIVQNSSEATNVVADKAKCLVTYHMKIVVNEKVAFDEDASIPFKDVQDLTVTTVEDDIKAIDAALGYTTRSYRADPPIFVLKLRRTGAASNAFDFTDKEMANRLAKAMVRAVELCGGGNKEPF
jgi:hypothetical protein